MLSYLAILNAQAENLFLKRSLELQKRVHRYALHWLRKTKSNTRRKFNTETCTFRKSKLNWDGKKRCSILLVSRCQVVNLSNFSWFVYLNVGMVLDFAIILNFGCGNTLSDYDSKKYEAHNLSLIK